MPIVVTQLISIPEDDVEFSAIRASGQADST